MCLAIPACVEEIVSEDCAIVNLSGVRREVSLALVEGVQPGDYVIVHVGFALQKIDPLEAEHTLALFAAMQTHEGHSSNEPEE
ncbi:HypC/HybG/HupF family hydrogenase formation chaperone [Nitrosomonas communis]|uniref:HypC/HybG/HupF family hydrogenase formation chaperone n=1 Tax=Nitrosomonas communis TaxID=44574 RepID=UPI0026F09615|nr:HypC/HybG/HupF family hydrogenase formation chaperone [Nitrosomonas communis]MCO6428598.1 HypC/HybG/HupF family hydrogenase formation chaperone [Nitrosomonas communis]